MSWTAKEIPSQNGRNALITGANSGIGLATARELARASAQVILACRDLDRGNAAADQIRSSVPAAEIEVRRLDLADLASVREFAKAVAGDLAKLDLLVNNAGVMAPPRRETKDGFEMQIGTNHLGHFALTGLLKDTLLAAPEPRVVTVSSGAHKFGKINFEDLQGKEKYGRWRNYGQSKLANLLFTFELERRAVAAGTSLRAMAAHPGYASTNLQTSGPGIGGGLMSLFNSSFGSLGNVLLAQSEDDGALPTLYAATVVDVPGASFLGPDGRGEMKGSPSFVSCSKAAQDKEVAKRLWEVSEELTGVSFEFERNAVTP